jgi:clathrin heavy chain
MPAVIDTYVSQIAPSKTPLVIDALLEENCPDDRIKGLIVTPDPRQIPIEALVNVMENHSRLLMLRPWLEARFSDQVKETALHNALAKILISSADERYSFC